MATFSQKLKEKRAKVPVFEKLDYSQRSVNPPLNPIVSQAERVERLLAGARMFDTYKDYLDSHFDKFEDELDFDTDFDPDGFELSKNSEDYEAYEAKKNSEIAELKAQEQAEANFQAEVKHRKRVKKALEEPEPTPPKDS